MTYMYYAMIGTLITVFVGIAVSLAFPLHEDDVYDEKLLHPLALKFSKWFPGRPRRFLKKEKETEEINEIHHTAEKTSKEVDNPVFELSENVNSIVIDNDLEKSEFSNSKDESDIIKNLANVELNRNYGTRF